MTYSNTKSLAVYLGAIASIGVDELFYSMPRYSSRSYHEEKHGKELAKAKGLTLYTFGINQYGKANEVYAKNDKEAIKRARKRGWDIKLLTKIKKN